MGKNNGLGSFLAGALVGAGLGVLFAPKSGAETRRELKEKFDELVAKIKEIDVKEVRDSFLNKVEEIKKELSELDKEKVVEIAKQKAEDIKFKVDELASEAKEKATPVVQKAANDLRQKTAEVLKGAVDRLENPPKKETKKISKKVEK